MEGMLLDHTEEFAQLHEKYITYHLELCNQRYMLLHQLEEFAESRGIHNHSQEFSRLSVV